MQRSGRRMAGIVASLAAVAGCEWRPDLQLPKRARTLGPRAELELVLARRGERGTAVTAGLPAWDVQALDGRAPRVSRLRQDTVVLVADDGPGVARVTAAYEGVSASSALELEVPSCLSGIELQVGEPTAIGYLPGSAPDCADSARLSADGQSLVVPQSVRGELVALVGRFVGSAHSFAPFAIAGGNGIDVRPARGLRFAWYVAVPAVIQNSALRVFWRGAGDLKYQVELRVLSAATDDVVCPSDHTVFVDVNSRFTDQMTPSCLGTDLIRGVGTSDTVVRQYLLNLPPGRSATLGLSAPRTLCVASKRAVRGAADSAWVQGVCADSARFSVPSDPDFGRWIRWQMIGSASKLALPIEVDVR
jgi:hypothetical protein